MLDAIEEEVVPLYYARNASGISTEWVRRCKHAMATVIPSFNMRRTVGDYANGLYKPAAAQGAQLLANQAAGAAGLAAWKKRVRDHWSGVNILSVSDATRANAQAPLKILAVVQLGNLSAQDLRVEFKARRLLPESQFEPSRLTSFGHGVPDGQWRAEFTPAAGNSSDGTVTFEIAAVPPGMGQYQLQVRVYPWHPLLTHPLEMGLMKTL
jgi:starch phosphorylase